MPYLNFEDELLARMSAGDLGDLLEEYYRRLPELRGREVVTSMRGRAWEVTIHPFSFEEFLRHRGSDVPHATRAMTSATRSRVEHAFLDYLGIGGFPEAQALDTATRHRLLADYVDVALLRNVVERHRVTNVVGLRWLVRHLLANAAGLFSVQKLYSAMKSQGLNISRDTVHQMLAHLEDCSLVRSIWVEAGSERQRMVNLRKTYPIDPALIAVYDRSGRANVGHALETVVLLELGRRHAVMTCVRTPSGREVDFLARMPGAHPELIQVWADARDGRVAERELRALDEAGRLHPEATKRLLVLTRSNAPDSAPDDVVVQPVQEWLPGSQG